MKIVQYSGAMAKDRDGVTKTLHELINSIKESGHDLMLWNSEIMTEKVCGLDVHRAPSIPFPLYHEYRLGFYGPIIKAKLDQLNADVFHLATPDIIGYNFMKYARKRRIPFVSVVFVLTERIKQQLHEHGIRNIRIWSRGIHIDRYNPGFRSEELRKAWGMTGKFMILYLGKFVLYKDLRVFIDIYKGIKKYGSENIGFVLVGSGPIEDELRKEMPDAVFPGYLVGGIDRPVRTNRIVH